jgi:hypothetical protein
MQKIISSAEDCRAWGKFTEQGPSALRGITRSSYDERKAE